MVGRSGRYRCRDRRGEGRAELQIQAWSAHPGSAGISAGAPAVHKTYRHIVGALRTPPAIACWKKRSLAYLDKMEGDRYELRSIIF